MSGNPSRRPAAVVLGALAALAPLSIDAYLPAIPSITTDLAGDPGSIQLTLTTFFAVAAAIMIVGRSVVPLVRRFGFIGSARRLLVVYAAAAVALVLVVASGAESLPGMCSLSVLLVGTLGGIIPSLNMPAMEANGAIAGTAAALIGTFQFLGGAIAGGVVGASADGGAPSMFGVIAFCGLGGAGLGGDGLP